MLENLQYFEISAKSNVRSRKTELIIVQLREAFPLARPKARWVGEISFRADLSNQSLEFVAAPALAPPEVQVDPALIAQYENELKQAANAPLPDEVRQPRSRADYRTTPTFKRLFVECMNMMSVT